jgi:long-chain acyl-CoA synthetase
MRTELDQRMDTMMAALTGEGGQLALGSHMRRGVEMPTIAVAPPTLAAYFAHYCQEHAAATFLVSDDERITFAEIHTAAMRIARGLIAEHGIAKGDRVGIAMRNSPAWIALYMGILIAGGVATLLNGWWQSEELAAAIEDVDCTLIFADAPRVDRLKGIDTRVIGIDDCLPFAESIAPAIGGADDDVALPEVTADDHATILFTSGSTGRSKGALSDHRGVMQGVFNYLAQAVMMLGLAQQDGTASDAQPSTLLSVPLFHVTAEIPLMLQSFAIGRKIVMMKKWDAEEAMRLIEKEKISYFVGVPLMSFEIVNHPNRSNYDLSSVTDFAAGGAPRPVEHVKRIDKEMG